MVSMGVSNGIRKSLVFFSVFQQSFLVSSVLQLSLFVLNDLLLVTSDVCKLLVVSISHCL